MDDLISRKAAIRIVERYGCNNGSALGHHSGVADCIASEIATLPAVDAVPVVHARWQGVSPFVDTEECQIVDITYNLKNLKRRIALGVARIWTANGGTANDRL